jgi:hypothetical protein
MAEIWLLPEGNYYGMKAINLLVLTPTYKYMVYRSVEDPDPESGVFLTAGSGIREG